MLTEKSIKQILYGGIIVGLLLNYFLNVLQENVLHEITSNISNLLTISRILASVLIMALTLNSKLVVKSILSDGYISGSYVAFSNRTGSSENAKYIEKFSIKQSLLSTKISGQTLYENGEILSNWSGKAFDFNELNEYKFFIEIKRFDGAKLGILDLQFESDRVSGSFFPTEKEGNYIWTIQGCSKKIFGELNGGFDSIKTLFRDTV